MKKLSVVVLAVAAFASTGLGACDFEFDGLLRSEFNDSAYKFLRVLQDDQGNTHRVRATAVPLNREVREEFEKLLGRPVAICAHGTVSTAQPIQYFIYDIGPKN